MFDVIALAQLEPLFIASEVEGHQLGWIPQLRVDLLEIALADLRRVKMD